EAAAPGRRACRAASRAGADDGRDPHRRQRRGLSGHARPAHGRADAGRQRARGAGRVHDAAPAALMELVIDLVIDHTSAVPSYEQICRQVVALVASGSLRPGDRLPTVRGLAAELGLAVNTVAKAFRELELRGAIETR